MESTAAKAQVTVVRGSQWWQRRLKFADLLSVSRWCATVACRRDAEPEDLARLVEVVPDLPSGWRQWVALTMAGANPPNGGFDLETAWTVTRRVPWPGDSEELWQPVNAAVVLVAAGSEDVDPTQIVRVGDRFFVDGVELRGRSWAKAVAATLLWLADR